jgi:predicted ATP-binding protein involved in virulence
MNQNLLKEWLADFKNHPAEKWFDKMAFIKQRYDYFTNFFKKLKDGEFNQDNFFEAFYIMCDNLHSLTTHGLALARAKGVKENHYSAEEYIEKLNHLIDKRKPVSLRINEALKKDSEYRLKFFGQSSISELIAYNEPEKYTFLNQRERQAIDIFDIDSDIKKKTKSKKFGNYFEAFNEIVKEQVLELYCEYLYGKAATDLQQIDLYSKTTLMLEIDQFISWLFENKDIKEVRSCFISEVEVSNFYSIKEEPITLKGLKNKKFIFLLGENGSGKTIFLKALLIALKKVFIEQKTSKAETGIILQILDENKEAELNVIANKDLKNEVEYEFNLQQKKDEIYLKNVYAYGTQRSQTGEREELYGFLSLFKRDQFMTDVENWLLDIERKELKKEKTIRLKEVQTILGEVLDVSNLEIFIKETGRGKVFFKIEGKNFSLNELSEGYQNVLILIIDLLARLTLNNPDVTKTKDFKAVVLIDELDLFLHPKWEKTICHKLHKIFPNIQFFVTTHSPILIDGATKDFDNITGETKDNLAEKVVVFRLMSEEGTTKVVEEYQGEEIKDWTPNILINSTIFDNDYLDSLPREVILKMRTENTQTELIKRLENISKVQKKERSIKERYLENLKKAGKI